MDLAQINYRQQIIDLIRQYFANQHFQEVTTPCLTNHPPLESTLHPFAAGQFYLAPSPENSLKKLISQGLGDCYSVSHSFRSQESTSPIHSPEFQMLEWYQMNKTYPDIIDTLQKLLLHIYLGLGDMPSKRANNILVYQNQPIDLTSPWVFLSLRQLFSQHAHQDLDKLLSDNSFGEPDFNQLFLNYIEPQLPHHKPVIITDYPQKFSYFAKPQTIKDEGGEQFFSAQRMRGFTSPKVASTAKIRLPTALYAQRFELYLAGIEIANGNTEDTNTPYLIPPCAGCGLGIDRLAMIFANSNNIQDFDLSL